MSDQRCSDNDQTKRDIPSFIEPRPPLILNPFMRPRPQKGTNLMGLFEDDSEIEEPEWLQVYLRLKPCNVRNNLYEVRSDRFLITSVDTATMGHGRRTQHNVSKMYTFSHIFGPECNQREIFEQVVKENLKKLPEGQNFTLLTYGASGSGKTFTLMGTVQAPGLVPRSLEYVFRVVDAAQQPSYKPSDGGAEKLSYYNQDFELQFVKKLRQVSAPLRDKYRRMSAQLRNDLTSSTFDLSNRTRYYVWVSFVEIYNEATYDLLSQSDRSKATSKLRIREDATGNVFVKGATQVFVRSGEEAYDVLVAGKHNLQVAATGVHANSSRSHCIFTITMLTETCDGVRTSCVRLCDLAGCERARHTRNTGARMQESRAINSSLHVLERCLHMLRRKQKQKIDSTLVPYRESKLTRLLGAGLSGARGEAVSMVVTLNPAPDYAHETKHVLQLAAIAKDIQVNQTMAESIFESSQETTMESSVDIMKLRADNERLHFELVQSQARNKELIAAMEEKQQEVAKTMYEIVEEAKDMTREYYEAQLQSLRAQMEEMQEEYESKLNAATVSADVCKMSAAVGTPTRMQKKIAELMTEIAILEENLTAERLARARAEEEVQHLRACIDERDEKASQDDSASEKNEPVIVDTESEGEDDEDLYNESLEPTFKKEDINKSRLLQQSLLNDSKHNTITDNNSFSDSDKGNDTLKDDDNDLNNVTMKDFSLNEDETHESVNEKSEIKNSKVNENSASFEEFNIPVSNVVNDVKINEVHKSALMRGTYVVHDEVISEDDVDNEQDKTDDEIVFNNRTVSSGINKSLNSLQRMIDSSKNTEETLSQALELTDKSRSVFKKSIIIPNECDVSLAQFEQLEIASKSKSNEATVKTSENFSNIKILNEKRTFFDDEKENDLIPKFKKDRSYFDNVEVNVEGNKTVAKVKQTNDDRSPSIVKEDIGNNFQPSMIKKLLGESFTRQPDVLATNASKKTASYDIFEGIDSPKLLTTKIAEATSSVSKKSEYKKDISELVSFHDEPSISKDSTHSIKTAVKETEKQKYNQDMNVTFEASSFRPKEKISIFEQCVEKIDIPLKEQVIPVEDPHKPFAKLVLEDNFDNNKQINEVKIKLERLSIDKKKEDTIKIKNQTQIESLLSYNNTVEEFENIYKDITAPRATEFDLLVSQNTINVNEKFNQELKNTSENDFEKSKYNLRHTKANTSVKKKDIVTDIKDTSTDKKRKKYTLRTKETFTNKKAYTDTNTIEDILLESQGKCESKTKPKRTLRLKRKNQEEDKNASVEDGDKLKDIVNLQKEFSDITMNVPAPIKVVKDMESPEKNNENENLPPLLGIQSCPSKSVTRSRRKLFTPRAEPLEESIAQSGESNEKISVPRPSYHRTGARRKL